LREEKDRDQRSEVGGRRSEVGKRNSECGMRNVEKNRLAGGWGDKFRYRSTHP
jgi:hypothetical protein